MRNWEYIWETKEEVSGMVFLPNFSYFVIQSSIQLVYPKHVSCFWKHSFGGTLKGEGVCD